ncbi:MAG: phospholipase D family protein [Actinomycetota bacterium]
MFAPDERAVLREALRPEVGETLVHAVGTTFSVDLSAVLAVPLAFAAHGLTEASDPIAVLEALRAAADRVDVFCQCGNIRAPRTPNDLAAFLEPMLHEVRAPQHEQGFLFHPKVWVARYDADGDDRFRLICLTRNLTDSAAWDAVVRLDGRPDGKRTDANNRPIMDLLRALPAMSVRQMEPSRQTRIKELADAIGPVVWETPLDLGSVSLTFHALGLRRTRHRPELVGNLIGRRHLVVSPFLDDEGIGEITNGSAEVIVVSRVDDLDRLRPETVNGLDCRVVRSDAGLAPADADTVSDESERGVLGGLHAKMYVVEAAKQAALFIGSANATSAGLFGRNVEFVVEFRGGPNALGIDRFLDPASGLGSLLEEYPAQGGQERPDADELVRSLERALRHVASSTFTSTITNVADGYTQTVQVAAPVPAYASNVSLQLGVYGMAGTAKPMLEAELEWVFGCLSITEISAFVVVTASVGEGSARVQRSTLLRSALIGDPSTRRDEILAKQFTTPDQFLRFLALLLGLPLPGVGSGSEASGQWGWGGWSGGAGLFELLVNAVASRPQVLDDLARLVERLQATDRGQRVLPEGFTQLWSAISEARLRQGIVR